MVTSATPRAPQPAPDYVPVQAYVPRDLVTFDPLAPTTMLCIQVPDGDDLILSFAGRTIHARLFGIDAPEKGQPYAADARALLHETAYNHHLFVSILGKDRYARTLVIAHTLHFLDLAALLLLRGLAWAYRAYLQHNTTYPQLEALARIERRGLWSHPKPVEPWVYRNQHRPTHRT